MQLSISGKHIDVGESLRAHAASVIEATVARHFGGAIEASVVFAKSRHLFRADVSVHVGRGILVQSHAEAAEAYAAFDAAADRLDTRLARYKGRLLHVHHKLRSDAGELETSPAQQYVLAGETEGEAGIDPEHGSPAVIAEMTTNIATLTVGQAVLRLDLADHPALMFRNRAHGGLNVVYRRPDGNVGWIDPGAAPAPTQRN